MKGKIDLSNIKQLLSNLQKYSPILFPCLLMILIVLYFTEMFLGGKVVCMRDMLFDFIPQHIYASEVLRSGHLPFWSTYSGFGKPFLADPQTATLYPLHIAFYLFSPLVALKFYCLIHYWITGVSMFALARHWRMDQSPALVVAISWMFSSWFIGSMEFANNFAAITWLPIILLLTSLIVDEVYQPSPINRVRLLRFIVLLAVFLCVQYLAGYPEFVIYTCILCVGYILVMGIYEKKYLYIMTTTLIFGSAGLIALLLASPQVLLSWEFLHFSERAGAINPHLSMASVHPRDLLSFLMPFINGHPGYPDKYWASSIYEFWLGTYYVGILPLIFACLPLLWLMIKKSDSYICKDHFLLWYLCTVIIFGIVMALGKNTPVYNILHNYIPFLNRFRYPAKYMVLVIFGISMLAGMGYQLINNARVKPDSTSLFRNILLIGGITLGGVLLSGYVYATYNPYLFKFLTNGGFPSSTTVYTDQLSDYRTLLIFSLIGFISVYCLFRWKSILVDILIVTIIFFNLFIITHGIQPMMGDGVFESRPKSIFQFITQPNQYRVHSIYSDNQQWLYGTDNKKLVEWALNAGVGDSFLAWNLHQTWQGGQKLLRYKTIYSLLLSVPPSSRQKLADLMGIRYIITGASFDQILWAGAPPVLYLGENRTAMPRAYMVYEWMQMENPNLILKTIIADDFDPTITAIVEPKSTSLFMPYLLNTRSDNEASMKRRSMVISLRDYANRVDVKVSTTTKALLVLNDAWYPGWKVLIDGVVHPIFRTNFHFRGVFIEPGEHNIKFIYDPNLFYYGLWISGVTFIVIIILILFSNVHIRTISIRKSHILSQESKKDL